MMNYVPAGDDGNGEASLLPMICIASALLAIGVIMALSNARGGDMAGGSAGEDTAHDGDPVEESQDRRHRLQ